jgi:uncharacterized protein YbaP (TraB family)
VIRPVVVCRATAHALASLLFALVALAVLGNAHAQNDRRGFLFEVRKGTQASLLFGTIHVGRPEFYPLPASRLSRMSTFDALVLEADITDTTRAINATQKFAMYPTGEEGLDKRLSPELLKRVDGVLARNQLDRAPMMRMKPWMLGTVLTLFEAAQAGYVPGLAAEAYVIRMAQAGNKPILELEGIEQQFSLFENAPWATQLAYLEDALKAVETNAARREINRIVQAWEMADRPALERLLGEMRTQTSVGARFTIDTILLGRHDAMVRRIETLMADGRKYLFAVGSLHLVGPSGLVEMLKARGYTVTEL